ncbi:hypothetical protein DRO97_01705 [Archaeoglobales archaeon]|nr:MAG: hypothetical protein DRO97_01705 [Archaeoglobales archaeon]
MKVSRASYSLITTSLFLLLLGLLFTSFELIAVSIFPLLILLFPNVPFSIKIFHSSVDGGKHVGEAFEVTIVANVKGFGIIKAMHELPEHFELVNGKNAIVKFLIGSSNIEIRYKAIPTKRGKYRLDRLIFECENAFLTSKTKKEINLDLELEVKHRIQKIVKIETIRGIARTPHPEIDISTIGVPGTDFREIREYVAGDPVKLINWKATARTNKVMVNQYEVEGKKAIWIFLDANKYMLHGSTIKNFFEAAIEAANSICYYFTTRNYKVGFYVVGYGYLIYPDSGRRQFKKISSDLMRIEVAERVEALNSAVERCKKYLMLYKPMSIFITRVEHSKPLMASIKASRMAKKKLPVTVLALKMLNGGDGQDEDEFTLKIIDSLRLSTLSRLRVAGIDVVEWDIERRLSETLMRVLR